MKCWYIICAQRLPSVTVDTYDALKYNREIPGQAHHLSQNAAFKDVIPTGEGLSVKLKGNAFNDIDSPHYKAHETLEEFWNQYRIGGALQDMVPTVGEYNRAMYKSLVNAGLSKIDAAYAVREAYGQQKLYGLTNISSVPKIPGRMGQKNDKG